MKKVLTVLVIALVCMSAFADLWCSGLNVGGEIALNGTYNRESGLKAKSINILADLYKSFSYTDYQISSRTAGIQLPLEYDVATKNLKFSPYLLYQANGYSYYFEAYAGYQFSSDKDAEKEGFFVGTEASYTFVISQTDLKVGAEYEAYIPQSSKSITTSYADVYTEADIYTGEDYAELTVAYAYSPFKPEDDGVFIDLSIEDDRFIEGSQDAEVTVGICADFHKVDGEIKKNAGVYAGISYENGKYSSSEDDSEMFLTEFDIDSFVKYNFIRDTADLIEFSLEPSPSHRHIYLYYQP